MSINFLKQRKRCFIIAEAGSNHNGSLKRAKRMIRAAKEAGCDAVKFQLFRAQTMYPQKHIEVKYLTKSGVKEDLYSLIRKLEVPYKWLPELSVSCRMNKIEFMATPFDLEAIKMLRPYVNIFKVASYESMFFDLIQEIKKTGKPLLISTGGSTEREIDLLFKRVLFDYLDKTVLLHCIAKYPAPIEQVNLNTIPYLRERYHVAVGYSDHTQEPVIAPAAAAALGATVVEKHFTLNRKLPGPDHTFAIEPDELKMMVEVIRLTETSTGGQVRERKLQDCENELYYYKRCIYAGHDLKKGDVIRKKDVIILRNTGIKGNYFNPIEIDMVAGRKLKRDKPAGEIVFAKDLI